MNKIYEAFEKGADNPNLLSKDKQYNINTGLGYEPILPKGVETTQEIASSAYQRAMEMLRKYIPANRIPKTNAQFSGLIMGMMQTLGKIKEIENPRREYLEMLAVQTVLELPEFSAAKDAIERGDLRIDATLLKGMIEPRVEHEEEVEEEVQEIEESPSFSEKMERVLVDVEQEKYKRRMQNIMAQGAAANYMYLFELSRIELNEIDPQLSTMYGFIQSVGDMAMWVVPDMSGGGPMKAGEEEVEEEDGVGVIKARAIIYPLLIHEIIKGLIVYINSHGLSQFADIRDVVQGEIDTPENEIYDLMLGPIYWKKLKDAVGPENQKHLMHVWGKITSLPAWETDIKGSFGYFIKKLLEDPETARRIVGTMIKEIESAIDQYERENGEEEMPTFESLYHPTFDSFYYSFLSEALTKRMKDLLQYYNKDFASTEDEIPVSASASPNEDKSVLNTPIMRAIPDKKKRMTEEEFEKWAAMDPTGDNIRALPLMLSLKKANLIEGPGDIQKIIDETTYVPLKYNEFGKIPAKIAYDPKIKEERETISRYIKNNAGASLTWVLKQINDKNIRYPEDLPSVKDTLFYFYEYYKTKYWPSDAPRDLYRYKTISDLFNVVFQVKRKLFASQMDKRIKIIYSDTQIIGTYPDYKTAQNTKEPLYELIRIFPTVNGQKSLHHYVNETGTRLASWCTAFPNPAGWNNFVKYLKLNEIPGESDAKHLSEVIVQNPIYSHYYIAKDGIPHMLFEFRTNDCRDIGDDIIESDNEEFHDIIMPMMKKYIPISRDILKPLDIKDAPSTLIKNYVEKYPDLVANSIICRLVKNFMDMGHDIVKSIPEKEIISRSVIQLLQELKMRIDPIIINKDKEWRSSQSAWSRFTNIINHDEDITSLLTKNINNIIKVTITSNEPDKSKSKLQANIKDYLIKIKDGKPIDKILNFDIVSMNMPIVDEMLQMAKKNKKNSTVNEKRSIQESILNKALRTAAVISTLGTTPSMAKPITRGIKNNNPGNIKISGDEWVGAVGHDGKFIKFSRIEYGIRAMAKILRTYQNKHGLKTIRDIIHRWAPKTENKTEDYIKFVSRETGIPPDQALNLNKDGPLALIINTMIKFENSNTVPAKTIFKGIEISK
jgi:hypothetical protein